MPRYTLIILVLFGCFWQTAQSQDTLRLDYILKWTPSMLLDPENSIMLGAEIPIGKRWSVQQEVGWGHNAFNAYSNEKARYPNRQTWRFRTQIRFYFPTFSYNGDKFYIAGEYFRKNVLTDSYQGVGRLCNPTTGACAFFEELEVRSNRRVNAFQGKIGYLFYLSPRFVLDLYVGGGIRDLLVTDNASGTPPNAPVRGFDLRSTRPGRYGTMPGISAGFHLGIALK
ncbi:MAG: DUF3575 domain-containing protein [Spirosomaceae bacterium]|jgi:hypothetical protein|nr:DUF3575 domain-containing protein [Spirosomataceae bacterium]